MKGNLNSLKFTRKLIVSMNVLLITSQVYADVQNFLWFETTQQESVPLQMNLAQNQQRLNMKIHRTTAGVWSRATMSNILLTWERFLEKSNWVISGIFNVCFELNQQSALINSRDIKFIHFLWLQIIFFISRTLKGNRYSGSYKFVFEQTHFTQLVRKKPYELVDILSLIGGFFGLFAGFSAISLIEVVYWMLKKLKEYFAESSIHGLNYLFTFNSLETYVSGIQSVFNKFLMYFFFLI